MAAGAAHGYAQMDMPYNDTSGIHLLISGIPSGELPSLFYII